MDQGLLPQNRLILISAPAGYGKTTLAGDWIYRLKASNGPAVAWLSLDERDNDPRLFLSYFITAIQKVAPGVGEDVLQQLDSPQGVPILSVTGSLLNDLAACRLEIVMVLDDYHAIHAQPIHEALSFLIDRLPPAVRLLVTSRTDPPFPLHRYRGRGQMLEIRLEDLRFNREEVAGFFERFYGDRLGSEESGLLEQRTEGWITGIQMAALSMRGQVNRTAFLRSLAGSNRYILDYLVEEVLKGQPEAVLQFLMQTSILHRLCGPLCEAVIDPDLPIESGQEMLEELEQSNLFLLRLDDERQWYRYHHLFADLLLARLMYATRSQPEKTQSLHRRAAGWLQSHGWASEAIQHYISGEDFEQAAILVEQHTLHLFAQGELALLLSWIRLLPPDIAAQRPWLCIYQSWSLAFASLFTDIEPLLIQAEKAIVAANLPLEEQRRLKGEMIAIRGMVALMSGDLPGASSLLKLTENDVPAENLFAWSAIHWVVGYISRLQGNLARAIRSFEEMLRLGRQMNNVWTIVSASIDLGESLRQFGLLRAAEATYREALETVNRSDSPNPGYLGRLKPFLANILFERNQVDEARRLEQEAAEHNRHWENANHIMYASLILSRIEISAKNFVEAERALDVAGRTAKEMVVMKHLIAAAEVLRVRLWLAQGTLSEASRWAAAQPVLPDTLSEEMVGKAMMQARVYKAEGNLAGSRDLLSRLEEDARRGGKKNALIEILTLKSLVETESRKAYPVLEEALALGMAEGYRRVYLDEGEPLGKLLEGYRDQLTKEPGDSQRKEKIARIETLLLEFPSQRQMSQRSESPLTEREVDILRCMAEGLTNEEIGRRLFIAAGTVKAHSAAIYRKLDVANRSEAIARAKDMGLF